MAVTNQTIIKSNMLLKAPITEPEHLVNKDYVDTLIFRHMKEAVRLASTVNFPATYMPAPNFRLNGSTYAELKLDGVSVVVGDRVLIKDQQDATQNGIYVVSTTGSTTAVANLIRSSDFDSSEDIPHNVMVRVSEGLSQSDTLFQLTNDGPIILDTSPLIFQKFSSGGDDVVKSKTVIVKLNATDTEYIVTHNFGITGTEKGIIVLIKQGNDIILANWIT